MSKVIGICIMVGAVLLSSQPVKVKVVSKQKGSVILYANGCFDYKEGSKTIYRCI